MTISDFLFRLIKSMSRTEKAYFKKFASMHVIGESNNYVELFDFIASMDNYDESAIKFKFSDKEFIRQLSVAKNYLYFAVLKTLRVYRRNLNKREDVKEMLDNVNVLMDKRLFPQAEKFLRKCRKLCFQYELHSLMLQVLVAESKIIITKRDYSKNTDALIRKNFNERKELLKIVDNASGYDLLDYEMTSLIAQYADSKDRVFNNELNKIISSELMISEDTALSLTAKLKYNHIFAAYYYSTGKLDQSYKYLSREIVILSKKPEMLEDRLNDYFILLHNRLLIALELGLYNELDKNILQVRSELSRKEIIKNPRLKFYISNSSYLIEMTSLNRRGNFEGTLNVYNDYKNSVLQAGYYAAKADEYWLNNLISQAYFGTGRFNESLNYLNRILNDAESEQKYNNIFNARIFRLLLHYELGNYDLLEYLIKSTYRNIVKSGKMSFFEKTLFSFLRKLQNINSEKEIKENFLHLKDRLVSIKDESSAADALKYFDYISWLESKSGNKSFAEILSDKSGVNKIPVT